MRESKFKSYQDLPLTLTAPEVGEVLGISRASAYELVRSKGFPRMKIGTRILVPAELAGDSRIRELYSLWYEQKEDVLRAYTNKMPERKSPNRIDPGTFRKRGGEQ